MERSIEKLVDLAKQEDQDAINELYNRTFKKAYFVARASIKSSDGDYNSQIEDILQDAYVKVFANLDKLTNPEKFQGWLDTIVINCCRDFLRQKKPKLFSEMSTENSEDGSVLEFEDAREDERMEFNPEKTVDYTETKRLIAEMLDRMPADQKMCMLMYYYEEMSVRQIAEALDCSEGTIKSRLNYARKNLKGQVLELEKKGTKLYCAPLFPFLYWFFRQQAEDFISGTAAAAVGSTVIKSTVSGAGGSNIASGAAGAGAKTVAAAGKASLGLGAKIAIIAVGAAIIVGGGAITVKTMAVKNIDKTTETVTEEESSEPETEEMPVVSVLSEPEEVFECFGLTEDEIIEKYGEPTESFADPNGQLELVYGTGKKFLFEWETCDYILYDLKESFGITERTDIHTLLDAIGGRVVNYWTEDLEYSMWSGKEGQTEVDIVSQNDFLYKLYLNNPGILEPENSSDFVVAMRIGEDTPEEDMTGDFDDYLHTIGNADTDADDTEASQGGMNASERRKAYYELIRSMSTGNAAQNAYNWNMDGLEKLEWSEADLDGDGVDEILFASGNYHAASVGIGKMVDGKAVYCGELGNSGALSYYPGTGYLMDDWTGGGGHTETLYSLSEREIQLIAQANYSDEYNAITDEYDLKEYSGELNGTEVSTSEAQQYIDNIKKQHGDGIAFQYGDAENHRFEELLK